MDGTAGGGLTAVPAHQGYHQDSGQDHTSHSYHYQTTLSAK